jgi:hypothetical protein
MLEHEKIVLLALVFLGSAGPAPGQTLAREYIHFGGRPIAVENAPTQPGMANLILGGPSVTAATTEAGSSLTFTFSATAGQQASFSFTQNSATGGNWISGTITKPDGSTLMSNVLLTASPGTASKGPFTLPTTGTYTITLSIGAAMTFNETVTGYLDTVMNAGSITLGGPSATFNTTIIGQSAQLTFSGTAGQQASFSFTQNSATGGNWISGTITKPDGSTLMSNVLLTAAPGTASKGPFTLPQTGTYTITLSIGGAVTFNETVTSQ